MKELKSQEKSLFISLFVKLLLFLHYKSNGNHTMDKKIVHKGKSIFQQVLEDKRAIRQCIQTGGDIKQVAKEHGIKFAMPL